MTTDTLKTATYDAVQSFIDKNQMFTAFDITMNLRSEGFNVYHSDVRSIVHDLFDTGVIQGYDRTHRNISLNTDITYAAVYHPYHVNPDTYISHYAVCTDSNVINTKPAKARLRVTDTKRVDQHLRLRIPSDLIKAAGYHAGSHVYVHLDPITNQIIIDQSPHGVERIIDCYHNLRIGLKKARVKAHTFTLRYDNATKQITAVPI